MIPENALEIICDVLAHVKIVRIVVEHDHEINELIAMVYVRDEDLSAALADNGYYARTAAIQSGLAVEICIAEEPDDSTGQV